MQLKLAYGHGWLEVEFPEGATTVIEPAHQPGLAEEKTAVIEALEKPIAAHRLRDWLRPRDRVCILFTDSTRATPNERLIPWLLDYLQDIEPDRISLLNQLGTHRPNSRAELDRMLSPAVTKRYRVLNHEPGNPTALVQLGTTGDGTPALLNRHAVEAELRIVTGFICLLYTSDAADE